MATTGASPSLSETVMFLAVLLPAPSCAVTVMTFAPGFSATPPIDQAFVPAAVPLPPRSLDQVTCVTAPSSFELPLTATVTEVVDDADAGDAIERAGDWVSLLVTVRTSVAMLPPRSRTV